MGLIEKSLVEGPFLLQRCMYETKTGNITNGQPAVSRKLNSQICFPPLRKYNRNKIEPPEPPRTNNVQFNKSRAFFMVLLIFSSLYGSRFELLKEYSKQTRKVAMELLRDISESLGLEKCYIEKAMDLESGLQTLSENLYPPCPQSELVMELPPHSDHGLLTILIQNEFGGL
ncbi:hypothetical protein ACSBR1_019216 [Camellia fascicularis]